MMSRLWWYEVVAAEICGGDLARHSVTRPHVYQCYYIQGDKYLNSLVCRCVADYLRMNYLFIIIIIIII